MNKILVWNHNIAFNRMSRLTYNQVRELIVGEHVYYVNTNDEIAGIVYDAKVIGKTAYMVTLECTPIGDTIEYDGFKDVDTKHIESFSFIDARSSYSYQALFDDLIFKGDIQ